MPTVNLRAPARPHGFTLICFSHLRWNFVFQRPQQLMTRFARFNPVVFWEEPVTDSAKPWLELTSGDENITVALPHLPENLTGEERERLLQTMLDEYVQTIREPLVRWYYTPMMLGFSRQLRAAITVYDCMDELANFRFAPPELQENEKALLAMADLVFTGGYSLYEAKRGFHPSVHPFPSSVDRAHFGKARQIRREPADQAAWPKPRLGFFGVIDERMDLELVAALSDTHPEWTIVMVGPVVKIDPAALPQRDNIAWLGAKDYRELPSYLAGWDVALMPFAINEATRFISPTKTPEYLAGGIPVVSTYITDVVRHYGELAAVRIAGDSDEFIAACESLMAAKPARRRAARMQADQLLARQSWDKTAEAMLAKIQEVIPTRSKRAHTSRYDYLVVGAGFAGAVMAERLAADGGKRVLVIDRRPHIAGNAFDHPDEAGILVHRYGPHIFHTNSADVFDYLSRFTRWRPYEHRVLAHAGGALLPVPINRTTLNKLYGLALSSEEETQAFLACKALKLDSIRTAEDMVVSQVGRHLYETFFRGYTRKQWGIDPSELDKSVTARIPVRTNTDDRYFTDKYQAMPAAGYTAMFEAMLRHPGIDMELGVDFAEVRDSLRFDRLVFTGPIDEYFGYCFGALPYRSLAFRHEARDEEWHQPVAVVNYPSEDVPYTRVTEYKHLTGQSAPRTSLTFEYPDAEGEPYYPIPRAENQELYKRYEALASEYPEVLFVGRLATYRYYNMDQVVGQALATYRRHQLVLSAAKGRSGWTREVGEIA